MKDNITITFSNMSNFTADQLYEYYKDQNNKTSDLSLALGAEIHFKTGLIIEKFELDYKNRHKIEFFMPVPVDVLETEEKK